MRINYQHLGRSQVLCDTSLASAHFEEYNYHMAEFTTIHEILNSGVESSPDFTALSYVGHPGITFTEAGRKVASIRGLLHASGVVPGDRVAIFSENMPSWGLVYFAVTTFPAVVVPVLPDFPADDVVNILQHAETKVLFLSARMRQRMAERLESLSGVLVLELDALNDPAADAGLYAEVAAGSVSPDDLAAIIYTSGTTGFSKGVMLSHRNIASNVSSAAGIPNMKQGERMLSILPLSHTYECTLGFLLPFSLGVAIYYLDRPGSASVLIPAFGEVRPHLMLSVPLFIEKIVRSRVFSVLESKAITRLLTKFAPTRNVLYRIAGKKLKKTFGGRLHFFGVGGAPLAADVERFLRVGRFPYAIGYGLTETAPLLAGCAPEETKFRSTGPAVPNVELRLLDGELQARGPNIMQGYYRSPELTQEVFSEDGWFRTGDLGEIDANGFVYIKGRSKNMILSASGENIYPEAIESVINQFSYVVDSLVIQKGANLIAKVHVNYEELLAGAGHASDAAAEAIRSFLDELRTEVNRQLSAFSRITVMEEQSEPFEKTPTFKIKRYLYLN